MYKTMFSEISKIEEEIGFKPQLIIVDHVDGNDLEIKEEFNKHVRYNWLIEGALIWIFVLFSYMAAQAAIKQSKKNKK